MRRVSRDRVISLALIAPSIVLVAIFVYGMIGWTGFVSLTKWNTLAPDYTFNGLANYAKIFDTPRFQLDLRNTVVFTIFFIAASLSIGLTLANFLDRHIRGEAVFRTIILFPMAVSFIVTGVVWKWLMTPTSGVNLLFGLNPKVFRWLTDPTVVHLPTGTVLNDIGLGFLTTNTWGVPIAMIAIAVAATWQMSGYVMALYLAGLRAIPDELREAARVDGASEWRVFRHVTLPMLTPVTVTAVIILGHISLKIYDLTVAMSPTGIGFSTDVPATYMWQLSFANNEFAKGAAVAMVMLALVATLIIPYLIWNQRQEAEL